MMPGTLRSASCSVVAPCERISACGTMLMNCGMSRSGVSVRVPLADGVGPVARFAGAAHPDFRQRLLGELLLRDAMGEENKL